VIPGARGGSVTLVYYCRGGRGTVVEGAVVAKRLSTAQPWIDAFKPACRARGMRFVSGTGFVLGDVYITTIYPLVFRSRTGDGGAADQLPDHDQAPRC